MNHELALAIAVQLSADPASPFWEKLIQYGALGVILAYLLWERQRDRKEDRKARHFQANALQENTLVTSRLSGSIRQLTDVLYLSMGHVHHRREDDTPPKMARPEGDSETGDQR